MGSRSRSRSPPRDDRSPPRDRSRSRSRSRGRSRGRDGGGAGKNTGVGGRWNERGFGFIKPDDGSEDIFCHVSAIQDGNCWKEGAKLEFKKVFDDRKGKYRAEEVIGGSQEDYRPRERDSYDDRRRDDRYDDRRRDDRYDRYDDRRY